MVERQKEQIKYETEILRFAWVTAVAVTGGNASLLLGEATVLRTGLLLIGLLFTLVLVAIGLRDSVKWCVKRV